MKDIFIGIFLSVLILPLPAVLLSHAFGALQVMEGWDPSGIFYAYVTMALMEIAGIFILGSWISSKGKGEDEEELALTAGGNT